MKEKNRILLLLLLALIIRIYAAFNTPVIAKDSIFYLQNAIHISSGEIVKGLYFYPPVYPALVALVYKITGNAEYAGQAVSVIMGTLTLLPFFFLAKEIFGESVAFVASILFVFQPFLVQHSGEAISESTYIFFFIFAIYTAWKAMQHKRPVFYLFFGLLAALAYLTRPEGIGLFVGFVIWFPIHFWLNRKRSSLSTFGNLFFASLTFLLLVAPYLFQVHRMTGEWRLNAKRNMIVDTGLHRAINTPPYQIPSNNQAAPYIEENVPRPQVSSWVKLKGLMEFISRYIKTLLLLINKFTGTFHQLLFIFLVYLLFIKKFFSYHFEGELFVAYLFILYLLGISLLYVSGRHLLQLVPLCLPWAAAAVIELSKIPKVSNFTEKLRNSGWKWSAQTLLIFLTIIILLPKTLAGHRTDKLPIKDAGNWIKLQGITSPLVLSTDSRVAYYAYGRHIQMNNPGDIVSSAKNNKPNFIVIKKDEIAEIPVDILEAMKPYSLEKVFQANRGYGYSTVTVYTFRGK